MNTDWIASETLWKTAEEGRKEYNTSGMLAMSASKYSPLTSVIGPWRLQLKLRDKGRQAVRR
jgi:hypothetical protein